MSLADVLARRPAPRASCCSATRNSSSNRSKRAIPRRRPPRRSSTCSAAPRPSRGPRPVSASNPAPSSVDLRVHGRGVLRGPADVGAGLERQAVLARQARRPARSAGLVYVPVEHDGQPERREEEVDAHCRARRGADRRRRSHDDGDGEEATATATILVSWRRTTPRSRRSRSGCPACAIGTVDKFQGQQAPVVIVSLTTSTPEDAPRGMDFLYRREPLERRDVARQCAVHPGRQPRLFEPDCRTPQQMRLANAFCLYRERARAVVVSAAMSNPCLACGACCAYFRASFHWSEAEPAAGGLTPPHLTTKLTAHHAVMRGTEQQPPRCIGFTARSARTFAASFTPCGPRPAATSRLRGSTACITSGATGPAPHMACRRCRRLQTVAELFTSFNTSIKAAVTAFTDLRRGCGHSGRRYREETLHEQVDVDGFGRRNRRRDSGRCARLSVPWPTGRRGCFGNRGPRPSAAPAVRTAAAARRSAGTKRFRSPPLRKTSTASQVPRSAPSSAARSARTSATTATSRRRPVRLRARSSGVRPKRSSRKLAPTSARPRRSSGVAALPAGAPR